MAIVNPSLPTISLYSDGKSKCPIPASNVSYPYPYGNFCKFKYSPYNYPFNYPYGYGSTYGYDSAYEYNNNYYNNYRTPYFPQGPYKIGPYY